MEDIGENIARSQVTGNFLTCPEHFFVFLGNNLISASTTNDMSIILLEYIDIFLPVMSQIL